ncbi:MAG: hypothetical protein ABIO70_31315 [Pseudomonadota bacterium]
MQLSAQPSFQFWIRRSSEMDTPYALRFKVRGGRGLLRVAHPDVLLDPPASEEGQQDDLTAAVIRASRFLLVADGGKMRKGFFLAALGDGLLERLPLGIWVELSPRVAGDMRLLVPLGRLPEPARSGHEGLEGDDDLITHPGSGSSDFYRVRDVLRGFQPEPPPEPPDEDAPVLRELTWGDDGSGVHMEEHTDPSIGSDPIFVGGGTEEEARALVGATLLASASMFDPPPAATFTEVGAAGAPAPAPPAPREEPVQPEPARIELEEIQFGPTRTALVRHLRRTSQRDHQQLEQLKSRVAELERLLAEVRAKAPERDG